MKKLIIVLLIASLTIPLLTEEKKATDYKDLPFTLVKKKKFDFYKTMQVTMVTTFWTDAIGTRILLRREGFREGNDWKVWWMKNDFRAAAITAFESILFYWWFNKVKKWNKTAGYILMGFSIAARIYVTYKSYHFYTKY